MKNAVRPFRAARSWRQTQWLIGVVTGHGNPQGCQIHAGTRHRSAVRRDAGTYLLGSAESAPAWTNRRLVQPAGLRRLPSYLNHSATLSNTAGLAAPPRPMTASQERTVNKGCVWQP